jgi:SNF2 family DNA or RNA helicase
LILNPDLAGLNIVSTGLELLDMLSAGTKKFVVFNNYIDTNARLHSRYKIGALYSEVPASKKREYLKEFTEGNLRGLTLNPKSGGTGLDLPMCQHIFMGELPITPRDFYQCVGRCHRQGQKESVIVTTLVAKGTIQESLYARIKEKDDLMKQVIATPRSLREDLSSVRTKEQLLNDLLGKSS